MMYKRLWKAGSWRLQQMKQFVKILKFFFQMFEIGKFLKQFYNTGFSILLKKKKVKIYSIQKGKKLNVKQK